VPTTLFFYGSLLDFVDSAKNSVVVRENSQLKDTIESFGVPHCEVALVLVDGRSAPFNLRLLGGEKIEAYPVDLRPDVHSLVFEPEPEPKRFLIDCNLGKLNSMLRSLGFDCYFENHIDDLRAAEIAVRENRILISKDRRILMRAQIKHGYWVRNDKPALQIKEVLKRFDLHPSAKLLSRCIDCNVSIVPVEKEKIIHRLEPLTKKYYDRFFICPSCEKIYWRGSHFEKIKNWYQELKSLS
jgi:uncharacterized protein